MPETICVKCRERVATRKVIDSQGKPQLMCDDCAKKSMGTMTIEVPKL